MIWDMGYQTVDIIEYGGFQSLQRVSKCIIASVSGLIINICKNTCKHDQGIAKHVLQYSFSETRGADLNIMKSFASPSASSSRNKSMNDSLNIPSKGKFVRGNPGLVAAVERDDFDDLIQKNGEYINRIVIGQGETMDSLTDMVDALGAKIYESSASATNLVDKLSALDNLIDEEKRKWIIQVTSCVKFT